MIGRVSYHHDNESFISNLLKSGTFTEVSWETRIVSLEKDPKKTQRIFLEHE